MKNAGTVCPLMKGKCIEHRCVWYIALRGTNKNTGKEIDEYGCAMAWLPMLMIENANEQRQTAAAVESLRNESIKSEDATRKVLMAGFFEPAARQLSLFDGSGTDDSS
jgi:hypothetical protein